MKEGAETPPPIAKVKKRARNISSDNQVATRVAQISNSISSKRPKLLTLKDIEEPNIAKLIENSNRLEGIWRRKMIWRNF